MSFCSLIKGIIPKTRMLCFVLINNVLLNLSRVWLLICSEQQLREQSGLERPAVQSQSGRGAGLLHPQEQDAPGQMGLQRSLRVFHLCRHHHRSGFLAAVSVLASVVLLLKVTRDGASGGVVWRGERG